LGAASRRLAMQDAATSDYTAALALLSQRRWGEAMDAFERAFARDEEGLLDRRPCFDWFRTIQIDEIGAFWLAELARFLRRSDIDRSHYATVAVSALRATPAFRSWLSGSDDEAGLAVVMRDELFGLLLRETIVGHSAFETALTRLRARLLAELQLRMAAPLEFLCDLSLQCFNNEFAYWNDPSETKRADALQAEAASLLAGTDTGSERLWRAVAVLGMYRPLSEVGGIDRLMGTPSASLDRLLRRTVVEVREERRLAAEVWPPRFRRCRPSWTRHRCRLGRNTRQVPIRAGSRWIVCRRCRSRNGSPPNFRRPRNPRSRSPRPCWWPAAVPGRNWLRWLSESGISASPRSTSVAPASDMRDARPAPTAAKPWNSFMETS